MNQILAATAQRRAAIWRHGGVYPDRFAEMSVIGMESLLAIGFGLDPLAPLGRNLGRTLAAHVTLTKGAIHRIGGRESPIQVGYASVRLLLAPERQMRATRRLVGAALTQGAVDPERPNWLAGLRRAGLPTRERADVLNHLAWAYSASDFILTCAWVEFGRDPALADALRAELLAVVDALLRCSDLVLFLAGACLTPDPSPRWERPLPFRVERLALSEVLL